MKQTIIYEEFDPIYYYQGSSQNWHMQNFHVHDSYELLLFMSGDATIQIKDRIYTVRKGDLFLINSKDHHKIIADGSEKYSRYVLMFEPENIRTMEAALKTPLLDLFENRAGNSGHKINLTGHNLALIVELFRKIDLYFPTKDEPISKAHINLIIAELLLKLHTLFDFFGGGGGGLLVEEHFTGQDHSSFARIEDIKAYVKANVDKKITSVAIAQHFFINKYYLSHYFKKFTGFTLSDYIRTQKIVAAKTYLKKGYSVTDTAMQLGYNSYSYFISIFKSTTGITPKRYSLKETIRKDILG